MHSLFKNSSLWVVIFFVSWIHFSHWVSFWISVQSSLSFLSLTLTGPFVSCFFFSWAWLIWSWRSLIYWFKLKEISWISFLVLSKDSLTISSNWSNSWLRSSPIWLLYFPLFLSAWISMSLSSRDSVWFLILILRSSSHSSTNLVDDGRLLLNVSSWDLTKLTYCSNSCSFDPDSNFDFVTTS